jgi:hypothetical protein
VTSSTGRPRVSAKNRRDRSRSDDGRNAIALADESINPPRELVNDSRSPYSSAAVGPDQRVLPARDIATDFSIRRCRVSAVLVEASPVAAASVITRSSTSSTLDRKGGDLPWVSPTVYAAG